MRAAGLTYLATVTLVAANACSLWNFNYTEDFKRIGGHTYHYLKTEPEAGTSYAGTVLLLHGFPDLPFGWHEQIPLLSGLGYRVIAPSVLGYFPTSVPDDLESYRFASVAGEIATLVKRITKSDEKVILIGHDWGMSLGWMLSYRHPDLIKAIVGMAVPHSGPPEPKYVDLADAIAANQSLNFGYQLQLRDPKFSDKIKGPTAIRQFLRVAFEGVTADRRSAISARHGVDLDLLHEVLPSPFLSPQVEEAYVTRLAAHDDTLNGPLTWYRTFKVNWEDDTQFQKDGGSFLIKKPTLFFCGLRDPFVPCEISKFMDPLFTDLTRVEVDTAHWIQIEAADEVNQQIRSFLSRL